MATDKTSQQQSKTNQLLNHPLADIAGKFGGEFWLDTQSEIKIARQRDKKETSENLDNSSKKQD